MHFTTLLLATLATTLSLLPFASARLPPYCTGTGAGYCNLGWQYDADVRLFHVWVYDRYCNQIGWHANPGFFETKIDAALPKELWVTNTELGPNFSYGKKEYDRRNCWYMQGLYPWIHAGQCAFKCG